MAIKVFVKKRIEKLCRNGLWVTISIVILKDVSRFKVKAQAGGLYEKESRGKEAG